MPLIIGEIMSKVSLSLVLFLILSFSILVKADVPPPKGYVRVSVNFVVETKEDLSAYRFFLNFYGDLDEIVLKANSKITVPPAGGGARYASGVFLAIPKSSLQATGEKLTNEELSALAESIRENKVAGLIELGRHPFVQDVTTKNKNKVVTPKYLVERQNETLVMKQQKKIGKKISFEKVEIFEKDGRTMIAGIFLSMSALFAGVFVFRKVS